MLKDPLAKPERESRELVDWDGYSERGWDGTWPAGGGRGSRAASGASFARRSRGFLHIDFAKVGYNKSNKKAYTAQMTKWLSRQEAIDKFTRYLQWAIPTYRAEVVDQYAIEGPDDDEEEEEDEEEHESEVVTPHYTIAKHIPKDLRCVSLDTLEKDYGISKDVFLYDLETFLRFHQIYQEDFPRVSTSAGTKYGLYRRFSVNIPPSLECSTSYIKDTIRATPAKPSKDLRKASPPQFDTVLARKTPAPGLINKNDFDVNGMIACLYLHYLMADSSQLIQFLVFVPSSNCLSGMVHIMSLWHLSNGLLLSMSSTPGHRCSRSGRPRAPTEEVLPSSRSHPFSEAATLFLTLVLPLMHPGQRIIS